MAKTARKSTQNPTERSLSTENPRKNKMKIPPKKSHSNPSYHSPWHLSTGIITEKRNNDAHNRFIEEFKN
jgi:hypothetical protein